MKNNELTKGSIPKLIKKMAIPASIGFFFNTMYNVVDTFYGGKLSSEALAALSISFVPFFLIIATGTGLATGATALISNSIGARKTKEARTHAFQTITVGIILSIIITLLGIYVSPAMFRLLGATDQYLSLSLEYMNVIFYGAIFFILIYVFNSILNATGDTKTFSNFLIIGFFLNVLLDPWFMFGWLGFPALGLAGVAWATVVIQAGGSIYMGYKASKTHLFEGGKINEFKPDKKSLLEISRQGIPSALNMFAIGIGIFVITYFVSIFGQAAVAAYGIGTRVEQIFLLPTIGITVATLTLVGQNNGAKKMKRVRETLNTALKYGAYIMTLGTICMFLFAKQFIDIFTNDQEIISIGTHYLRIVAFLTWAYATLFISISTLQGMKKPSYALWIGLFRQIIAPTIIFYFFVKYLGFGINAVWWGIFSIVWLSAIITIIYTRHVIKKSARTRI